MTRRLERGRGALAGLVLAACGPVVTPTQDVGGSTGTPGTTSADSTTGSATTGTTSTTGAVGTSTSSTSTGADGSDGETNGCFSFRESGSVPNECNPFAQDCPPCEKCMPWANDGGGAWNADRCVPIEQEPRAPGEECTVYGNGASGMDDCERGAMCWYVDPKTNLGTCVALCTGSEANPACADPGTICIVSNDGVLPLCLAVCDPIAQDCPVGQACREVEGAWVCAFDASGDTGGYGESCYYESCAPGLVCLDAGANPNCTERGCCTEICDLADPAGDAQCTGAPEGQICQPWYEPGTAPRGYEDVGICALPP